MLNSLFGSKSSILEQRKTSLHQDSAWDRPSATQESRAAEIRAVWSNEDKRSRTALGHSA